MRRGGTVTGAVSLVMIFVVLCMTVFAVLTLSTAVGESRLAQATAAHVQDYYEADARATAIAAQVAAAPTAPEIDGIPVEYVPSEHACRFFGAGGRKSGVGCRTLASDAKLCYS